MKIGVVGHGSIGSRHAANARALGHEVLVYDPKGPRDVKFEREIYDQCEAVIVATPSGAHEGPLRACVERGKHILLEKPISITEGALPSLLQAADDKNLVVMMGNNLRFHPCVQQAKQWISAGHIGQPLWGHFICAQLNTRYTDSVVLNWGAHEVDLALFLLGPAEVVYATGTDRMVDFVLQHESGVRSSHHLDYETPKEIREFWIAGDEKNVGVDVVRRLSSLGDFANNAPGTYSDDYTNELRAFVGRINGEITPGATGWDGLATLRVLLEVQRRIQA